MYGKNGIQLLLQTFMIDYNIHVLKGKQNLTQIMNDAVGHESLKKSIFALAFFVKIKYNTTLLNFRRLHQQNLSCCKMLKCQS